MSNSAFLDRLANGGNVIVGEGYLFEMERRGYLQIGAFVPEVVLEHPERVKALHEEFVHAGSDAVVAFTYYGHREKMRLIGREGDLELINKKALSLAREVARATGTLFAGDICNTTVYRRNDEDSKKRVAEMFKEQVKWAVEAGVDYIIAETFNELGEAMLALESIKTHGNGVPAVITMVPAAGNITFDGIPFGKACRVLEDAGAAVVGLNCGRGPATILPLLKDIRTACKGPIACLPVTYRTNDEFPTFQSLTDPTTGDRSFPVNLPAHACSRSDIEKFASSCKELGVQYVGLCCGSCSHYLRIVAEKYGRQPPASQYSPEMSLHHAFGDKNKFDSYYTEELANYKVKSKV